MILTENPKYHIQFIRKKSNNVPLMTVNAVLELSVQYTVAQIIKGFNDWKKRDPEKMFIVAKADNVNSIGFLAKEISSINVKPCLQTTGTEGMLLLSKNEINRLRQLMLI